MSIQDRLEILERALAIDADVLVPEEVRSGLEVLLNRGLLCTPWFPTCPSPPTSRLALLLFFDTTAGLGSARTFGHQ